MKNKIPFLIVCTIEVCTFSYITRVLLNFNTIEFLFSLIGFISFAIMRNAIVGDLK